LASRIVKNRFHCADETVTPLVLASATASETGPGPARFVKSIRSECWDRFVIFGERHLRHLIREFSAHYHTEPTTRDSAVTSSCPRHRRVTTTHRQARSAVDRVSVESSISTVARLREE
jgi:hypothetical protein